MKGIEMNKVDFENKLKNKQFDECIEILRKEIIKLIENKIKEKDSYFFYTTTEDLYKKSKNVLPKEISEMAYELYSFDIMYELDEYVLSEMLQMYKILVE